MNDLSDFEKAQARAEDPTIYRQRPHALSAEVEFSLQDESLAWEDAKGAKGHLAYADIVRTRLAFDPARIRQTRHVLDLYSKAGARIRLTSTTYAGMGQYKPRNRAFAAFVRDLHGRIATANPGLHCETGRGWAPYVAYLGIFVVCLAAMAWGVAMMWGQDQRAAAGVLALMVAYFCWLGWDYGVRNRPAVFDPRDVPARALPAPSESDV